VLITSSGNWNDQQAMHGRKRGVNWNVRISSFPVFLLNSEIVVYFEQKNVRNRFRMLALTKTKLKHNCKPFNLLRFYTFCKFQQITMTRTMSWLRGNIYFSTYSTRCANQSSDQTCRTSWIEQSPYYIMAQHTAIGPCILA